MIFCLGPAFEAHRGNISAACLDCFPLRRTHFEIVSGGLGFALFLFFLSELEPAPPAGSQAFPSLSALHYFSQLSGELERL